jgi:hypothetical protein
MGEIARPTEPNGRRISVWLTGWQSEALRLLAEIEHRETREQAAVLIVAGLHNAGILEIVTPDPKPAARR